MTPNWQSGFLEDREEKVSKSLECCIILPNKSYFSAAVAVGILQWFDCFLLARQFLFWRTKECCEHKLANISFIFYYSLCGSLSPTWLHFYTEQVWYDSFLICIRNLAMPNLVYYRNFWLKYPICLKAIVIIIFFLRIQKMSTAWIILNMLLA